MPYQVVVDPDVCISSGKCVADEPEAFRFDADEIAQVAPDASNVSDERLLDVARTCPSGAIRLFDGDAEIDVG